MAEQHNHPSEPPRSGNNHSSTTPAQPHHSSSSYHSSSSSSTHNTTTTSPLESLTAPRAKPQPIYTSATSSTTSSTTTPHHTPRRQSSSPSVSHRSSFIENISPRNYPSSPRAHTARQQSFSGSALTDLLMQPSSKTVVDERFTGRDWRTIQVHEIVDPTETRFVELDTSIEDTTKLLVRSGAPNVVLVRESTLTKTALRTFDYSDLNAYLLLVLGLSQPDDQAADIAERTRRGDAIPLKDVTDHLGPREDPVFIPSTANVTAVMEILGTGHHRIIVNKEGTSEALGVLTQLRLVRFFWDNHQNFSATEKLYAMTLKDLGVGAKEVIAISGDKPVADALRLMHAEGITSLPVLDSHRHVVGNISHVDVRLLTDTSAIPLLNSSCIHFVGVILSERGVFDGKDSYPVFHVTPFSTLAHTVAKLCATRSHRMWIVDTPSPSTSVPPSPGLGHATPSSSFYAHNNHQHNASATTPVRPGSIADGMTPGSSYTQLPGANLSGRLSGVVSLTDVLNLFAKAGGLSPGDPEETRRRRRQSSSSSVRPSMDSVRPSMEGMRQSFERDPSRSMDLSRAGSVSSTRDRSER